MDTTQYFNDLLVRMEELFYHELSDCAGWKTQFVGVDFIQSRNIKGKTPEELVENCIKEIKAAGLVKDMSYAIGGKGILLKLDMKGCIHLLKEARLKKDGFAVYNCPIANMLLDQLVEKLNFLTNYIAEIKVDEKAGACHLKCAIYETLADIGKVSDWNKE